MTLQTQLDALRDTLPACKSTAFGDLSAQLILRSSTARTCAREVLDAACSDARAVFDALSVAPETAGIQADTFARCAVLFDATTTRLFVRHDAGSEDAVLAELDGGQPIAEALSEMARLAGDLAEVPR